MIVGESNGSLGLRGVIRDETGAIVAEQTFHSIDAANAWGAGMISAMRDGTEEKAKALIMKDADGALYSGLAVKVEESVEDTLNRVGKAITGGVPLPRIEDGDTATGIWQGKAATLSQTSFKSIGGQPAQSGETAVSNIYEEGLAGMKKIFGVMAQMELSGEPMGEVLYAPIVEPDDPDTFGFIAG